MVGVKKFWLISLLFTAQLSMADCCSWYDDVSSKMERFEKHPSDGSLWLSSKDIVTIPRREGEGSCTVNQVLVEAPIGQEKEWFSMLLAATTAGKKLNIYADCNEATDVLTASRIVLEYK